MRQKYLHRGKDIAQLISSDVVHYGDEEWDGNNYAPCGTDSKASYATSISQPHLKVVDLRMGRTAFAAPRHWVGYPAIGFK